ncbi:MAG: NADH-quinone oxidoreductase subunit M [Magnetococcales bacterium]|nr:NADH-quinone oxidoreductase subunit M [Magnetococcales bacterium]
MFANLTSLAGFDHPPILFLLQLLPAAGAGALLLIRREAWIFPLAVGVGVLELAGAIELFHLYDPLMSGWQWVEHQPLVGFFAYSAAADGMTVLFMLLTAFLTLMAVVYGRVRPFAPRNRFFAAVLASEAALMTQFATLDLLWFVLFSGVQTVLAGYLMHTWSDAPEEGPALTGYYQFMGIGHVLLLAGTILLGWIHADALHQGWRFDLPALMGAPIPILFQGSLFFLLFYGFGVRIPLFPLHGWLPAVAEHGTVAPALVFILGLKTGFFGLLRFVFPLLPGAVEQWSPYAAAFAAAGIFYAALLALMQGNLRRMMAYAVVSHTCIVTLGLFSLHSHAFLGSILLIANFGLAAATLFFMVGLVNRRTHTAVLDRLGGLFDRLPWIGLAFFAGGWAIVAMPGTPGFDAAHLMLEAAIHRFGALVTIAAALGNVTSASFLLWSFQRVFLAPPPEGAIAPRDLPQAVFLENLMAFSMIFLLLTAGFFSDPWLQLVESTANALAEPYAGVHAAGEVP